MENMILLEKYCWKPILSKSSFLTGCCALTRKAAKYHTAVCSLLLVGWGREWGGWREEIERVSWDKNNLLRWKGKREITVIIIIKYIFIKQVMHSAVAQYSLTNAQSTKQKLPTLANSPQIFQAFFVWCNVLWNIPLTTVDQLSWFLVNTRKLRLGKFWFFQLHSSWGIEPLLFVTE